MIVRIESLRWYSEEDEYSKDKNTYKIDRRFVKEEDIIIHYNDGDRFKNSVELHTSGERIKNVINISYPIHNDKYPDIHYKGYLK